MLHQIKIDAVIFDMDGILIDSEPLWKEAEKQVLASYNIDSTIQARLLDTRGLRVDEVVRLWIQAASKTGLELTQLIEQVHLTAKSLIEKNKPALPGVEHALELCKSHGLKIGLVSASPQKIIDDALSSLGITHYFDAVVSSENMVNCKPHPEVYLETANLLDVSALSCVAIEDSVDGMIACKAARMRSIVVTPEKGFNDPRFGLADFHLTSLLDLSKKHFS
ncbi:hexitol phosphatase HxpB [Thorsellia kenyensis]|uniref:Hexitol phosphatase HxpB n=1 Tax=Thorsellia kenyensis TaxID=1549888 RepID=A0ABV6CBX2_9GAMM